MHHCYPELCRYNSRRLIRLSVVVISNIFKIHARPMRFSAHFSCFLMMKSAGPHFFSNGAMVVVCDPPSAGIGILDTAHKPAGETEGYHTIRTL
jgi:hypothetical protein